MILMGDDGPVSYTHLDVYKRQVLEYAGELSVILSVGFAILAAMAVFSYRCV